MSMPKRNVYIDFIHHIGSDSYKIEGYFGGDDVRTSDVSILLNNKKVPLRFIKRVQSQDGLDQQQHVSGSTFEAVIELVDASTFELRAYHNNEEMKIEPNRYTRLPRLIVSYAVIGGRVFRMRRGVMHISPTRRWQLFMLELGTILSVVVNFRIPHVMRKVRLASGLKGVTLQIIKGVAVIAEALLTIPKAVLLRTLYFMKRPFIKRPIWVISDRVMAAGDNGEALFRYIQERDDVAADVYFVISRKSSDYLRIKQLGPVVNHGSIRHLLLFLLSDKVISSHADTEIINSFGRQVDRYLNLTGFDFVFLQHGVIRHDLSGWLNRFNKNIQLFIVSSEQEKQSILGHPYYYDESVVVATGLPRYDYLRSTPKNKIILSPTHRNFLIKGGTNRRGERRYNKDFKNSEYFDFYNSFINDEELLKVMEKHEVQGEFYLHPVFKAQAADFDGNHRFRVMSYPYDYAKAFREGGLLITDYSSVVFDFAYLKKPILYAQFDVDRFNREHTSTQSSHFDDREDGFGVVCGDYDSLVGEAIASIEVGFKNPVKFNKRADSYFVHHDQKNAERVYYAILGLNNEDKSSEIQQ